MDSKSSAQMVSRGQMQDCIPWQPLDHGIVATISVGILAPIGYGAQRVIIHAAMLITDKRKTECHHLVPGSKLPPSFSSSSFWRKSYVGNWRSDLHSLSIIDGPSLFLVPKMDDRFRFGRDRQLLALWSEYFPLGLLWL
jgi:hypothetical protein